MKDAHHQGSALRTYVWIIIMVAIVLSKGWFAFFIVKDQGQPTWDYRTVKDLPAQSPYASYALLPSSQHVRGARGD